MERSGYEGTRELVLDELVPPAISFVELAMEVSLVEITWIYSEEEDDVEKQDTERHQLFCALQKIPDMVLKSMDVVHKPQQGGCYMKEATISNCAKEVDHTKGLCGKSDAPDNTSQE